MIEWFTKFYNEILVKNEVSTDCKITQQKQEQRNRLKPHFEKIDEEPLATAATS